MSKRAADIEDLEKMLNNGESDDALSARAIEIFERLKEARRGIQYKVDIDAAKQVDSELEDFRKVIAEIQSRRHSKVLDRFKAKLKNIHQDIITV